MSYLYITSDFSTKPFSIYIIAVKVNYGDAQIK